MTSRSLQMQTHNGHDKRPMPIETTPFETIREAGTIAQTRIVSAANRTEKIVKAHPLKSVGVALGGGFLLGAMAFKAFGHKTTLSEAVHERLGLKRWIASTIQSWL